MSFSAFAKGASAFGLGAFAVATGFDQTTVMDVAVGGAGVGSIALAVSAVRDLAGGVSSVRETLGGETAPSSAARPSPAPGANGPS
jgi:hypothetical protein